MLIVRTLDEFQDEVVDWVTTTFGPDSMADLEERALRACEEFMEVCQSAGLSRQQVEAVADWVYSREKNPDLTQEIGGALTTLAALASAHSTVSGNLQKLEAVANSALWDCHARRQQIRFKNDNKPDFKSQQIPLTAICRGSGMHLRLEGVNVHVHVNNVEVYCGECYEALTAP